MSRGHFGTGTELSRPPANIFVTTVIQKKGLLVIIINEDHWFYSYAQEYTADDYPLYSRTVTTSWSKEITQFKRRLVGKIIYIDI